MSVKDLTRTNLIVSAYRRGQSIPEIARWLGINVVRVSQILRESTAGPGRSRQGNPPPTNARASD